MHRKSACWICGVQRRTCRTVAAAVLCTLSLLRVLDSRRKHTPSMRRTCIWISAGPGCITTWTRYLILGDILKRLKEGERCLQ